MIWVKYFFMKREKRRVSNLLYENAIFLQIKQLQVSLYCMGTRIKLHEERHLCLCSLINPQCMEQHLAYSRHSKSNFSQVNNERRTLLLTNRLANLLQAFVNKEKKETINWSQLTYHRLYIAIDCDTLLSHIQKKIQFRDSSRTKLEIKV